MKVNLKTADPAEIKTQALIVFIFAEDRPGLARRPELAGIEGLISPRLKAKDFTARHLSLLTLFPEHRPGPERVILMGLGPEKEYSPDKLRPAAAKAAQAARDLALKEASLILPPGRPGLDDMAVIAETAALGARLGMYQYDELKTNDQDKKKPLRSLTLIRTETGKTARLRAALEAAGTAAEAIRTVRDLVNRPANLLYPESLAAEARKLAGRVGLKVKVLDMAAARRRGMGAFLGVAQGSLRPGRIIIIEYMGAGPRQRPVALIGKAITFDSGGLNLKQPEGMVTMKTDMAGGAAVLGVVTAAARMELKVNLVAIIPAAENMPDGAAYRPGDVLTTMSKQTVEISNTDAEGRLILADGLTLASEYKPKTVIDIATLTGACAVALGQKCAGLFGNDPKLIEVLKKAGETSGDRVWPMPLFDDYFDLLKSEVADFKNAGTRFGGAITAGLFLKKFVGRTAWAHLDIAGPARAEKAAPDTPAGGTGFGVNLLLHYLRGL